LAVVPAVKAAQFSGGNVLDAVGRQVTRFWLTMMAAALNLGLNLMLIPRYSWNAAVGTTLTAETLLALAFWVVVLRLARAERAGRAPLQDPELRSR
jgi:O-antigen/teichoic acid export membrane protein